MSRVRGTPECYWDLLIVIALLIENIMLSDL
jgi:hypothetical protein